MKKKMLSALLAAVFAVASMTAYSGVSVLAYNVPSYLKVGLKFGNSAVSSAQFGTSGGMVIGTEYNYGFTRMMTVDASTASITRGDGAYLASAQTYASLADAANRASELSAQGVPAFGAYYQSEFRVMIGKYLTTDEAAASVGDVAGVVGDTLVPVWATSKMVIVDVGGYRLIFDSGENSFGIVSATDAPVSYNGKQYRGYLIAERRDNSDMSVINLVQMEDYLAGVVGSEMYASWPIEALKAQAVIARTYACATTSYAGYGIDVTDDTRTQAYGGVEKETDATWRAAQETSGVMILYNGAPAQTYFCSSSGGKTADVYSAWGGGEGLDYLVSVDDPYEDTENIPGGVWSVSYTADELSARLVSQGYDVGHVISVVVTERGERDERVHRIKFIGTAGEKEASFDSIRTVLGLRSTYFYLAEGGGEPESVSVLTAEGTVSSTVNGKVSLGADGNASVGDRVVLSGAGETRVITAPQRAAQDTFTFNGRGYGHGVGMSQYGAKGMAEAGFGFRDIILHYYPGTELSA